MPAVFNGFALHELGLDAVEAVLDDVIFHPEGGKSPEEGLGSFVLSQQHVLLPIESDARIMLLHILAYILYYVNFSR